MWHTPEQQNSSEQQHTSEQSEHEWHHWHQRQVTQIPTKRPILTKQLVPIPGGWSSLIYHGVQRRGTSTQNFFNWKTVPCCTIHAQSKHDMTKAWTLHFLENPTRTITHPCDNAGSREVGHYFESVDKDLLSVNSSVFSKSVGDGTCLLPAGSVPAGAGVRPRTRDELDNLRRLHPLLHPRRDRRCRHRAPPDRHHQLNTAENKTRWEEFHGTQELSTVRHLENTKILKCCENVQYVKNPPGADPSGKSENFPRSAEWCCHVADATLFLQKVFWARHGFEKLDTGEPVQIHRKCEGFRVSSRHHCHVQTECCKAVLLCSKQPRTLWNRQEKPTSATSTSLTRVRESPLCIQTV